MRRWDRAISEVMPAVEFTHVESDGYEACNSFNTIGRRYSEGASNPKSCLALYFFEFVDIFNNRGAFEKPKVKSVHCNR